MADLLYKELSFSIIGAAMEVHNVLDQAFLRQFIKLRLKKS